MVNLVRDASPKKIRGWVPLPMAMAVPFVVGAYFAIDMCMGSLFVFIWHKMNKQKAKVMVPAGLICGDSSFLNPCFGWNQTSNLYEVFAYKQVMELKEVLKSGNQSPLRSPMSGHMTPYDSTAPASNDKFTRCEHIIPAPM
ncbi:Oligopeptide transporter OPT superfamily [Cynara cardunculus var. scolymus]|uniref:Oligopeptide transporter OPT superfamily n=1 Tax=Cynara cardunculus var. scolymus TaxID=59895 RepID=A0A103YEJ7_CYNCS|nr:Oligopeptide transporter OPT superfamily [Cynara cardunculus var. scolymus]